MMWDDPSLAADGLQSFGPRKVPPPCLRDHFARWTSARAMLILRFSPVALERGELRSAKSPVHIILAEVTLGGSVPCIALVSNSVDGEGSTRFSAQLKLCVKSPHPPPIKSAHDHLAALLNHALVSRKQARVLGDADFRWAACGGVACFGVYAPAKIAAEHFFLVWCLVSCTYVHDVEYDRVTARVQVRVKLHAAVDVDARDCQEPSRRANLPARFELEIPSHRKSRSPLWWIWFHSRARYRAPYLFCDPPSCAC
ncbi:hypothetical protein BC834DRAFT_196813 [Gloeopeniophorella convolvens]|nr:hypothetical protein BC834DRAFT_196813 [Gloeopeniophorella convolvens]